MMQTETIDKKQLIPEGYKQTTVGVIPEEWKLMKKGDAADLTAGGTPRTLIRLIK